ncbi:hypothetical protein [uncultured Formosa sp.]|uniref:hypothetical protein n=1 Tax=uncultured Formosa sp. TaxID=255435 RepID=UPI002611A892|nr:hypothetical protein [uncultured Formosa sp.]
MKRVILYTSLLSVLVSCLPKHNNTISEIEILNDIFLDIIGTEYYYKKPPIPPMPLEYAENKHDSINYQIQKQKFDEAINNPKIDKSALVLGIDSYFNNPKKEFKNWDIKQSSCLRIHYSDSLYLKEFDQLLTELTDSISFNTGKLELSKLTQTGKYIIKDLAQLEKQNKEYWNSTEYRYIASIRFSDFKINKKNDSAIFYLNFTCGNLCGSGEIIFCIKECGKWKIMDRNILWVS